MPRSRSRKSSTRRTPRILPQGVLKMSGAGYGFVQTSEGEFFIPASKTADAFDGDMVEVARISNRHDEAANAPAERATGRVVRVVGRAHDTIVGRYEVAEPFGVVVPEDSRIKHDIFTLRSAAPHVQDGDIVRVRMTSYPTRREPAQGEVLEVLGHAGQPGCDVDLIVARHKLATHFSPAALDEVANATVDESRALASGRYVDLSELCVFTIDPADAKDFDDALSVRMVRISGTPSVDAAAAALASPALSDASARDYALLGVHIADVSYYVPWNSACDTQARERATSVYLVDRVLPMLPEKLSNDICSLRPREPRRAFSAFLLVDEEGMVRDARFTPSVICSKARLSYDVVLEVLNAHDEGDDVRAAGLIAHAAGECAAHIVEDILALNKVAHALHAQRVRRGGMDFESEEAKVRLDAQGRPTGVSIRRKTEATSLVEEAMIAANEAVARFLRDAGVASIYRVHEAPSTADLAELAPILQEFGYDKHVPVSRFASGEPAAIQKVLSLAQGKSEEFLISGLVVRAMKRAEYRNSCEAHFGLASEAYTHFTSPIRRYPDLMVHRMLKVALFGRDGQTSAQEAAMARIAEHASMAEREADDAARESQELKLYELLEQRVGEEEDGIVSGVTAQGFFVRLADTAEGFVALRDADEYFILDAARRVLYGSDTGISYRLGMRVRVRIAQVWPYAHRADFTLLRRVGPRIVARRRDS